MRINSVPDLDLDDDDDNDNDNNNNNNNNIFTGHLDTGFSWFPCVYKRMLKWFPSFQVATTCFSCSPPDLNFLVTFFFIFVYV